MKRKPGRPFAFWAEVARVKVWYLRVKILSGLSDYQLNSMFAWTDKGQKNRAANNNDRPRIFEWIRKEGRKPLGLDWRWHDMQGLLGAVDRCAELKGLRQIYDADIWMLFREPNLTYLDVEDRLNEVMSQFKLTCINPQASNELLDLQSKYSDRRVFEQCLRHSLSKMDGLTVMKFLWLLYLQLESPENWRFRECITAIQDGMFANFFKYHFYLDDKYLMQSANISEDQYLVYYENAIAIFKSAKLIPSTEMHFEGRYIKSEASWPILPKDMADFVSQEKLFALEKFKI